MVIKAIQSLALTIFFMGMLSFPLAANTPAADSLLQQGRTLYHLSVDDKDMVRPALHIFEEIQNRFPELKGKAMCYIGSLYALKGKHAFWPFRKLSWVKKGLAVMDSALQYAPDDIEIRFIRGSTMFFLPSFFDREHDALQDFHRILALLPENTGQSNPGTLKNALTFIRENITLSSEEKAKVDSMLEDLAQLRN